MNTRWMLVVVCGWIMIARDAQAYIDPGTGSFILQMLIASILGALLTLKLWFGAAKRLVRRVFGGAVDATDAGAKPPPVDPPPPA